MSNDTTTLSQACQRGGSPVREADPPIPTSVDAVEPVERAERLVWILAAEACEIEHVQRVEFGLLALLDERIELPQTSRLAAADVLLDDFSDELGTVRFGTHTDREALLLGALTALSGLGNSDVRSGPYDR